MPASLLSACYLLAMCLLCACYLLAICLLSACTILVCVVCCAVAFVYGRRRLDGIGTRRATWKNQSTNGVRQWQQCVDRATGHQVEVVAGNRHGGPVRLHGVSTALIDFRYGRVVRRWCTGVRHKMWGKTTKGRRQRGSNPCACRDITRRGVPPASPGSPTVASRPLSYVDLSRCSPEFTQPFIPHSPPYPPPHPISLLYTCPHHPHH